MVINLKIAMSYVVKFNIEIYMLPNAKHLMEIGLLRTLFVVLRVYDFWSKSQITHAVFPSLCGLLGNIKAVEVLEIILKTEAAYSILFFCITDEDIYVLCLSLNSY